MRLALATAHDGLEQSEPLDTLATEPLRHDHSVLEHIVAKLLMITARLINHISLIHFPLVRLSSF